MDFNKIYANGCSFIWGHNHNNPWYFKYFEETKDIDISAFLEECKNHHQGQENTQYTNPNVFKPFNEFDWVREKYNYANRIAEWFGVELVNESIFGGSTHRMFRKTIQYIIETNDEDLQKTLFLIEIPPIGRGEMYFCNQERYVNFVGDDNFDFIKKDNFEFIQEWYDKSFDLNVEVSIEYQKLYLLLNLFKSKNIKFVIIQTNDRINELNVSNQKYGKFEKLAEIQNEINKNSVKFTTTNGGTYDLVDWFSKEMKCKFCDDTDGVSFDGHNSIRGSKLISEQIIDYIKNNF
jgi:hypothetical protein